MNRAQRLLTAAAIAMVVLLGAAAPALATHKGPDTHASCVAILTTDNTHHPPPTRADIAHIIKAVSDVIGLPPGALVSFVADLHLETVGACDAAIPAPPV